MELPYLQQQLDFIVDLAEHRNALLNPIFSFLNYFDTPYFAAFLIPLVWYGFSCKSGLKVAYLFLISTILNNVLKYAFDFPRPTAAIPEIGMFFFKSPGLPSGGAQTAILLGSLLMYRYRNWTAYLVGIFYILLVSFSRLYLGVHYPIDILAGWIVGGAIFIAFIYLEKPIDDFLSKNKPLIPPLLAALGILALFLIKLFSFTASVFVLSVGAFIGCKRNLYEEPPHLFWKKIFKGTLAGLSTLICCGLFSSFLPLPLLSILLGLWISLGVPLYRRFMI
jgi:membrane-associated phospholipid phosphatase